MNVEKLHAIALEIKADIEQAQIVQLLQQMTTHLQNVVNQPQQPQHQEQLSKTRKSLNNKLDNSVVNNFSPAWSQSVEELGMNEIIGATLSKKINLIFSENKITPQVALKEIQQLHGSVNTLQSSLTQMIAGFTHFKIGHDVLEPGEGELGILLPRAYLDNRFDKLGKEIKELNSIFSVLSEVGTGTVETFKLRSLSTTDPFITLGVGLGVLSTIAIAVKPIISAYKEILEVRLLHAQLSEKKVSASRLIGVEEHAEEIMGKAIDVIKIELLERYPLKEIERKNELSNALGPALKKLADRVDRGFNIEVRVEPNGEQEGVEDEGANEDKNIQIILDSMEDMEFIRVEGEPILHLSETIDRE